MIQKMDNKKILQMHGSKKVDGLKTPKMDGWWCINNGKPYEQMGWFGG